MENRPLDFSPLDPAANEVRWRQLQRRVAAAAAPELARRAGAPRGIGVLSLWTRPILSTAAALALVSLAVFRATHPSAASEIAPTVEEALGFPMPVSEWIADERSPDADDLLLAFERRSR